MYSNLHGFFDETLHLFETLPEFGSLLGDGIPDLHWFPVDDRSKYIPFLFQLREPFGEDFGANVPEGSFDITESFPLFVDRFKHQEHPALGEKIKNRLNRTGYVHGGCFLVTR